MVTPSECKENENVVIVGACWGSLEFFVSRLLLLQQNQFMGSTDPYNSLTADCSIHCTDAYLLNLSSSFFFTILSDYIAQAFHFSAISKWQFSLLNVSFAFLDDL